MKIEMNFIMGFVTKWCQREGGVQKKVSSSHLIKTERKIFSKPLTMFCGKIKSSRFFSVANSLEKLIKMLLRKCKKPKNERNPLKYWEC
jgi:hypothetical protein